MITENLYILDDTRLGLIQVILNNDSAYVSVKEGTNGQCAEFREKLKFAYELVKRWNA